jgi:hypothetical protein
MSIRNILSLSALGLLAALASPAVSAKASEEGAPPASAAPLLGSGLQVVETSKLYRVQERPWSHIPTGARILVRAPAGTTEADLHRSAVRDQSAGSPLSVPGAKVDVVRRGDLYELRVTASARSAALEIQHRASAL